MRQNKNQNRNQNKNEYRKENKAQSNFNLARNKKTEFSKNAISSKSSEFPKRKDQRWVVGTHAIEEAIKVNAKSIDAVYIQQAWQGLNFSKDFINILKLANKPFIEKPKNFLDKIYPNHQGCLLLVNGRPDFSEDKIKKPAQIIFLDGIEDPHNLGAICRTSWLLGVQGIFIPSDKAVDLTPAVHKVSCGGVEYVPIVSINQFKNQLERFKELEFWIFGLSHKAKKTITETKLPEKIVWCVGAEEKGLRSTTEKLCDELLSIPQIDANASYNASVATSIALFEGHRQNRLLSF